MENLYQPLLVPSAGSGIDLRDYASSTVLFLHSLGHVHAAERLEQETGIANPDHPLKCAKLISQIIGGFWENCVETLLNIDGLSERQVGWALYKIFKMWLKERLYLDKSFSHVKVLENNNIHRLSEDERRELYEFAEQIRSGITDGLDQLTCPFESRKAMLKELGNCIPKVYQRDDTGLVLAQLYSCLLHNTEDVVPLFCDHFCAGNLPTKRVQSLKGHTGRVLCLKFSHNGQYLASGSSDRVAIIWEVLFGLKFIKRYVLKGHMGPVTFISWSPDDESLLTCCPRENIKLWDSRTGICSSVISEKVPVLKSCFFLSRSQIGIVYGTSTAIYLVRNGCDFQLSRFGCFTIDDFVVTPNGKKIIYKVERRKFTVVDIETGYYESLEEEEEAIIRGFSVSEDSESLVMSLSNNEIHVWDLNSLKSKPLTYWGYNKATIPTRPCFGGVDSRFLACGADDGKVRIWNRRNGMPIKVLDDHQLSAVRCVDWNPKMPRMLACTGEEFSISIWCPESCN